MHGLIGDQQGLHPQALQPPLGRKWQRFAFCPRGTVPLPHGVAHLRFLRLLQRPYGVTACGVRPQQQDATTGDLQKPSLFEASLEGEKALNVFFHDQHEQIAELMS